MYAQKKKLGLLTFELTADSLGAFGFHSNFSGFPTGWNCSILKKQMEFAYRYTAIDTLFVPWHRLFISTLMIHVVFFLADPPFPSRKMRMFGSWRIAVSWRSVGWSCGAFCWVENSHRQNRLKPPSR